MLAALAIDLLDAAAPGFDVASAKKGAGDEWVVGRFNARKLSAADQMVLLFLGLDGRRLPWKKLVG